MTARRIWLSLVVIVATLVTARYGPNAPAVTTAQAGSQSGNKPAEERAVPVVAVVSRSLDRTLPLPGDLLAFQDVAIHARVPGFVQSIAVDRGSVVRRGSLLARIDAPELKAHVSEAEAKVQTAEAQLLEAQAALTSERSTFDRLKKASETPGVGGGYPGAVGERNGE
jgi:multidrug efflux pump subunit AcrA (membrane-fusion protein)